jgi:membrane protein YdbS with pleckstrin-like domain
MKWYRSGEIGGVVKSARVLGSALVPAALVMLPATATAYVGPGAGLTLIGSAISLIVVVIVAVVGLIIWPVRVIQRRRRETSKKDAEGQ